MKKISFIFAFCFLLSAFSVVFAYTSEDVETANILAQADILVDQSSAPDKYRLDDTLSRQEVIGMALKIKGVVLPQTYQCKGYFTDAIFPSQHRDAWVCRAVEIAADKGLLTRENTKTRPSDTITKVEALALIWKGSGMSIETTHSENDGYFYDGDGKMAEKWQENLLQTARKNGVLTGLEASSQKHLWNHNTPASRKEIFAVIVTIQGMKKASTQSLFLNFSGEVQYVPKSVRIISTDPIVVKNLQEKKFSDVIAMLKPTPLASRTEGHTLFVLQNSPDFWGHVNYSSIVTYFGKVFQIISPYNPYEKAMKAMLQTFDLPTEAAFYSLPYGDLWEKTRDFIEEFYREELQKAPIVFPSSEK